MVVLTTWAGRWRLYRPCCVFKKPLSSSASLYFPLPWQTHSEYSYGTSPTTIPLKQPAILVAVSNLENNCLAAATARTCRLMASVSVAGGTETRARHVGCSSGNKQRNAECSGTCQSKQRSSQTGQQHRDTRIQGKAGVIQKINSAHKCRRQSLCF